MPYAPDFYIPENIIGYTGVLDKNPTVYFLSTTHYGHITQVHKTVGNSGREAIFPNATYQFGNGGNPLKLRETDSIRQIKHLSRGAMILIRSGEPLHPALTHAIMVHIDQKALDCGSLSSDPAIQNVAKHQAKLYGGQGYEDIWGDYPNVETTAGGYEITTGDVGGLSPSDKERTTASAGALQFLWSLMCIPFGIRGTRLEEITSRI